jgi:PAS domain S-box-containing protein
MKGSDGENHYWLYMPGLIGISIVLGYVAFEIYVYNEVLEHLLDSTLEHFIIFSIVPLSVALGYAMDRNIQVERKEHLTRSRADTVISSIGEGVVELDRDFKILSVNEFVLNLTKRTKDEIVGKKCYKVFHELQDVCGDCPVSVTFLTGKPSFMVHEGKAKDGTKTFVELNSYPLKDSNGEIIRVIETVKDISERKKHEEEMIEKRELEKVVKLATARELKMVELKREINDLKKRMEKYEAS